MWDSIFRASGETYRQPKLVIFRNSVHSACGMASEASGPFYCPGDEKVYMDLGFFDEMKSRFGTPGDFDIAYVIAHKIGHHIQNQLGIIVKASRLKENATEKQAHRIQVKVELQADFLAGVWAHYMSKYRNIMEEGDTEEALNATSVVGDDRLQQQFQGRVVPDAFNHGTSEQRMRWFKKGYQTGDINEGNTLAIENL